MPEDFQADYGYLADLCAACGWILTIARIERGERMALRIFEDRGGRLLAGVKFTREARLDTVAEIAFDVLRARDLV